MAGDLKFVITAVDNASKALGKVGQETEKLGKGVAGLNAAARVISAGAIIAFGAASVRAFAEAEKSQAKLEQAYKRFPALANVQISSLRSMNQALQDKTGADADSLAAAQATLAQFKLTGEQIQQLTPLLVDYATVTGQDVTTAATSLGRAFMGNTRALKAIGIDFKATGDRAKDFGSIMGLLEGKVGGAGEAFGQTTAGQLEILQQSFQDLQEEVGAQLVPALKALVAVAKPVLGAFSSLPEPVKAFTVAVGAAAAATLLLGPRVLGLVNGLRDLMPAAEKAGEALAGEAAATEGAAAATGTLSKALGALTVGVAVTAALYEATMKLHEAMGTAADNVTGYAAAVQAGDKDAAASAERAWANAQAFDNLGNKLLLLTPLFPVAAANMKNAADAASNMQVEVQNLGVTLHDFGGGEFDVAGQTASLSATVSAAKEKFADLKTVLAALGGPAIGVDDAMSNLYQSFDEARTATDGLDGAVTKNKKSLDLHTEAGRTAQSALAGIAKAADEVVTAQVAAGASTETVTATQKEARKAFIEAATGAGLSQEAAESLADAYGLIPGTVKTTIENNAAGIVRQHVIDYIASLNNIPEERRTQIITEYITEGSKLSLRPGAKGATGGYLVNGRFHYDIGGAVTGPGTGTSDSVPAMLSNGEYVIRAAAVQKLGLGFLNDINADGVLNRRFGSGGNVSADTRFQRFTNATDALIKQEQALRDLITRRAEQARSTAGRFLDMGALSNLIDGGAFGAARDNRRSVFGSTRDALGRAGSLLGSMPTGDAGAVQAAMERLNMASSPAEAAAARQDLAAAQAKMPTMGNLLGSLRAKARALSTFAADLRTLASKKKIPADILQELIAAGPEQGGQVAKMLLSASTPELKSLMAVQAKIDASSESVAALRAGMEPAPVRVSAGSIIKSVRGKVRQLEAFAHQVTVLAKRKRVPAAILRDIIAAGPDEGGQMARALLVAKTPELKELVRLQNRLEAASDELGGTDAVLEYNPQIRRQRAVVDSAYARATRRRDEFLQVRTQVTLDAKVIAEGLANYKRAQGGRKLGLD